MPKFKQKHIDSVRAHIKSKRYEGAGFQDVATLAEVSADALKSFFNKLDQEIYTELESIVHYIEEMKQEIGSLQAQDFKKNKLPAAGHELDLVVQSTAEATNTIMSVAETILSLDSTDKNYATTVNDNLMSIFEACSFQDLTGQRISKVVETLNAVESRLEKFISALKVEDVEGFATHEEKQKQQRKKALLLNGPQDKSSALQQESVDSLFSEMSGASIPTIKESGEAAESEFDGDAEDAIAALFGK